jgi:hypothetical protein
MVSIYLQNDPLPTPISNCHPEVIVELLKVTVGVVGFNEPPEHNAAGVEMQWLVYHLRLELQHY